VRTEITRLREKARTERAELDALLDSSRVGHFALTDSGGHPMAMPTAIARDGDRVLAHGSTGSPWMRRLAAGAPTCLAVTALDALVVARSAFESSLHYRSAVLFGACVPLDDADKPAALDLIAEALLPGRTSEIRRPSRREIDATLVLALPIGEWSLKVSDGWPDDPPQDLTGEAWAGVVPIVTNYAPPRPAPDLNDAIPIPPSVHALTESNGGTAR
jgi:hypothetical protein